MPGHEVTLINILFSKSLIYITLAVNQKSY